MNTQQRQLGSLSGTKRRPLSTFTFLSNIEIIAALLILIFPVMGTFFAPETYFAPQDFSIEGADNRDVGFPFGRIAFMVIILWEFYLAWRVPKQLAVGIRRAALPLTYAVWAMVTGFWTYDPGLSLNRSLRVLIVCVFAAYLAERFEPRALLRLIAIAGAVAIVASVFAALALPQYGRTTLIGYEGAWRGATLHKNALGALMAWIFAFSCFAYLTRTIDKRLGVFLLLGSTVLIVMARSATALITCILAVGLIGYFTFTVRLHSRAEKTFVLILGVLGLCLAYVAQTALELFLQALGRSSDFTGRKDVWEIAWEMIQRKPIWGYGSSFWSIDSPDRAYVWNVLGWAPPHAHDNFLDFWLQLGLPGLILMILVLIIVAIRTVMILLKREAGIELVWPTVVTLIYFGGLTETNLVENSAGVFWLTLSYSMMARAVSHNKTNSKTIGAAGGVGNFHNARKI